MTATAGDIVRIPFPYADQPVRQRRPALVVAAPAVGDGPPVLWVLMITSAAHRPWPGDIPIPDHAAAGLPAPSVIRIAKIATIDARDALSLGRLGKAEADAVRSALSVTLSGAKD